MILQVDSFAPELLLRIFLAWQHIGHRPRARRSRSVAVIPGVGREKGGPCVACDARSGGDARGLEDA